jgi:hypothetical protein
MSQAHLCHGKAKPLTKRDEFALLYGRPFAVLAGILITSLLTLPFVILTMAAGRSLNAAILVLIAVSTANAIWGMRVHAVIARWLGILRVEPKPFRQHSKLTLVTQYIGLYVLTIGVAVASLLVVGDGRDAVIVEGVIAGIGWSPLPWLRLGDGAKGLW